MNKKILLLLSIIAFLPGCAFELGLGSSSDPVVSLSALTKVQAELAVAKENIRNLEDQRRETLAELEKARADITMLTQRLVDLASAIKSPDPRDIAKP